MSSVSDVASSAASIGAGLISDFGVGTSLNVNAIITALMSVQDAPVTQLQSQETGIQSTISAYGTLQSVLSQFQTSLQSLGNSAQYETPTATVADSSVATATATSSASVGTYSLSVSQLAQSQSLIATGQASATSSIGAGTITFNFGTIGTDPATKQTTFTNSGSAQTVTIPSSDDSLTGIAAAINAANIGVTASVLNDGSNTPYRLSLTSNNSGAANSMSISVAGDNGLSNLLDQDPTGVLPQNMTQTTAAQNAQFTVNGLAVTSSSNTDSSVIPGVTLNLLSVSPSTPTTLSVSQDTSGAVNAVNSFVSAYNTVQSNIQNATKDGTSTTAAGPLVGNNTLLSLAEQMQNMINAPITGASGTISSLAQVGVTFNTDGSLSVNNSTLEAALSNNATGVSSLFASVGSPTDSLISYVASSSATQPGSYAVNITQLATQGNTVGTTAAATTIAAGQDTLQLDINGTTASVTLAAGSYQTSAQLAAALQTAINTNSTFSSAGQSVSVTQNAGILTISSNEYGSMSSLTVTGGDGELALLGTPTATQGLDVAGTINGNAAVGSGQSLISTTGDSAGLNIQVNGGSTGDRGTVNYSQGIVNQLNNLMTSTLSSTGSVATDTSGLQSQITELNATIANDQTVNQEELANLQSEYAALDVTLSNLNNMSTYLAQQLGTSTSSSSSSTS